MSDSVRIRNKPRQQAPVPQQQVRSQTQIMYSGNLSRDVINICQSVLKRELLGSEKYNITVLISKYNPDVIDKMTHEDAVKAIAGKYLQSMKQFVEEDAPADIHEILKSEIGQGDEDEKALAVVNREQKVQDMVKSTAITRFMGARDLYEAQTLFSPDWHLTTARFSLDTRRRQTDNDGTQFFRWVVSSDGNRSAGVVNTIAKIRNINSLKVTKIKIPSVTSAITTQNLVSMFIREFGNESVIGPDGSNYHFIFDAVANGSYIDLIPQNEGYYKCTNFISALNSITISFGSPHDPIVFDTDRLYVVLSYNPATPTYIIVTTLNSTAHKLQSGDKVYFTNAKLNPVQVSDIDQLNVSTGVTVNVTSASSFFINITPTTPSLPANPDSTPIECYFDSKRIYIDLTVEYLKDHPKAVDQ